MIKPAHIVFLVPGFPKDEQDDTCIPPLQSYIKHLSKKYPELKISIISLQYPFNRGQYNWNNLDVYSCSGNNRKHPFKLFIWHRSLNYFKIINAQKKVNLIHSFWLHECALLGNYFRNKYGIPHVATAMGQDVLTKNKYFKWINFSRLTLIVLSDYQQKVLENQFGETCESRQIIPWGIDLENIPEQNINEREIDVLGVGSLISLKNFNLFIKLISQLKKEKHGIKAVIIGGGPEKNKLQKSIKDFELNENIKLVGQLTRQQVFSYMSRSKILLHTSEFESQGYVFNEALYLGMYIVSFPVGVFQEHEKWKTGITEDELLKSIHVLLSLKMNHNAVILSSMENTVIAYDKIYKRQLNEYSKS